MFDELDDYQSNDHFFITQDQDLKDTCNAPDDGIGVYLVYRLKDGEIDLVYIGSSGKITQNGDMKIRNGGMADRIINGKQFGGPRKKTWKQKLKNENIDALDIYWYETFDGVNQDIPAFMEALLLQKFFNLYGKLPLWNKEL